MPARRGASPAGPGRGPARPVAVPAAAAKRRTGPPVRRRPSRPARLAAVLAAAATLAAACSGSPQGVEPAGASLDPAPAPTLSGSPSTAAEADNRESSDGSAGVPEGEGGSVAGDGAVGNGTTGDSSGASAAPSGSGEGAVPEDAASQGAASRREAADGGASGRVSGRRAASGAAAAGHGATGDGSDLEPFATGPIAPLTGSSTNDLSLAQRRALAVKIGNGDSRDRPQAGLATADIVYEVLVEAGFTRFLAVFHSEIPGRVGPVRSVRSTDFGILEDLAAPYLVSSGANSIVRREMRDAARAGTLIDVGAATRGAPYSRDRSRPAPHNLYFHYENLGGGDPESLPGGPPDAPPEALFEYGAANSSPMNDAAGVNVAYTTLHGGEVSHVWDRLLGGWVRIQDGILHTAETDFGAAEIAPANVVVLWTPYDRSAADRRSPQALSYGAGRALVLTAGSVHEGVWERDEDRVGYRFSDAAGRPLALSPGSTWLLLANTSSRWPVAEVTVLSASESNRLLADARAAAES